MFQSRQYTQLVQHLSACLAKPELLAKYFRSVPKARFESFFEQTHSIFKDSTDRMIDLKGYKGYQRHQNQAGPGQYSPKQPFLRKTFNTTLPLGKFV